MKIYGIHIGAVAAVPEEYLMRLMPQRFTRSRRYLRRVDQLRCLGAGLLLHRVLGIEEKEICYGEFGKPYAPDRREFNLSHGGDWVILAEDSVPLGVDIEPICQANLDAAHRAFTSNEKNWMRQDPLLRFHILWTLKESIMKGTGLGMQLDLTEVDVLPVNSPKHIAGNTWHTAWMLYDGNVITCASQNRINDLEFEEIML